MEEEHDTNVNDVVYFKLSDGVHVGVGARRFSLRTQLSKTTIFINCILLGYYLWRMARPPPPPAVDTAAAEADEAPAAAETIEAPAAAAEIEGPAAEEDAGRDGGGLGGYTVLRYISVIFLLVVFICDLFW